MLTTQIDIDEFIDRYGDMALRIAYTYLKNKADAEDVVQDVFIKVMENPPAFHDSTHEKSWMIRTTINMCKNKLNVFWNRNKCSMDEAAGAAAYDTYNVDTNILNAVMSLPDKYRIVVYMYYYEGYHTSEISKLIGKNDTTVRSLLYRARNRLKEVLKEDYDFE